MKITLSIFIALHAIIHLLGFFKSILGEKVPYLNLKVSKPMGLLWLVSMLIFFIAIFAIFFNPGLYYGFIFGAVILSQGLIMSAWKDAKFGTIANVVILIISILTYFNILTLFQ